MGKNTVFISYGRDENNPKHVELVKTVKNQLEQYGFNVLMDIERLKSGSDWELQLEADILKSEWVLFFLTPYSARRPDGYCLNELAFALTKKKKILPLMVSFESLPLSICRLQYIDLQNAHNKLDLQAKILEIISILKEEKTLACEGEQVSLLHVLKPLRNNAVTAKHIYGFVGRQWIYDRVDKWLKEEVQSRVLWITAEAGYGKSSLSTFLSSRHPSSISVYFCQHDTMETKNPSNLLRTLIYELSTQLPEYSRKLLKEEDLKEKLQGSSAQIFRDLMVDLLLDIPEPEKELFFVIDALDEAKNSDAKNEIVELIANNFVDLPQWLNIIITSRPEPELIRKLKKFNPLELQTNEQDNLDDCRQLILEHTSKIEPAKASILLEKSEGNMLYLINILAMDGIRNGTFSIEEIEQFPIGMEGFYQQYFERKFNDIETYEVELIDFVNIIVASNEGMPSDLIKYILDINERSYKKKRESFGSLLDENNNIVTFYHKSLFDWLSDYDLSGDYSVDIDNGNKLIIDRLWELYKTENRNSLSVNYEPYLLQALHKHKEYEKLNEVLIDIFFIGEMYNHHKQDIYKNILASVIATQTNKCDIESLKIYDSFFREKEHLLLTIDKVGCQPKETLFQLAYEDGDDSPLSQYVDMLLKNNRVDFLWLKMLKRKKSFSRLGLLKVLQGHVNKINGAKVLNDERILSYSEDKTLRLWSSEGELLGILRGHNQSINGVHQLSDGRILSYSNDKTLRLWNSEGEPLAILKGHSKAVLGVQIFSDGRILSYSKDMTMRIWSTEGKFLAILRGLSGGGTRGIKILSTGKIITYSFDKTLRLWSSEGEHFVTLYGHRDSIMGVKIFNDDRILSYSLDNTLRLWSPEGESLGILEGHSKSIIGVKILSDERILSYSDDKTLRLWSSEGEPLATLEGHRDIIKGVQILSTGKILSYSTDNTLRLWSSEGELLAILEGHHKSILGVQILSDGRILSYSDDKTLRLWNSNGKSLGILLEYVEIMSKVIILSDDKVLSYSADNTLRLWSSKNESLGILEGHRGSIRGIKILSNGRIVSYSEDKRLRLWSSEGESVAILEGHSRSIAGVQLLNDGRIVSYSDDNTLRLWSSEGEALAILEGHSKSIRSVTILSDERILSYSADNTLRLWTSNGEPLAILEGHSKRITGVQILSDERILSCSDDKTLRLWSSEGEPLAILAGHKDFIKGVQILNNGKILFYSNDTLHLLSSEGESLAILRGHRDSIKGVQILSDGKILSYSADNTLRLWTSNGEHLAILEGHIKTILGVQILSDGKILSYSADNTLRLWTSNGEHFAILEGHKGRINGVKILSNDKILSYSDDKTLRLWGNEGVQIGLWNLPVERMSIFNIDIDSIIASNGKELLFYNFFYGNKKVMIDFFGSVI